MEESLMGSEVEGMSNIPDIICNAYGYEKHDAGEYSPLTLAYIGDTIYGCFHIMLKLLSSHPFTAPAVMPLTICFWKTKYKVRIGTMDSRNTANA